MFDRELALEILLQIHRSSQTVLRRFEPVTSAEDFTNSDAGMEKLDAICMQLIAIGESLKKFDSVTENRILPNYSKIEWKKAIGLRDIISHHYFDINAEAIYNVCKFKLSELLETVQQMIHDMKRQV
jgi:uncharacterized protein with HEPN domain